MVRQVRADRADLLIPIVGQMNLYGWMLACADNLQAGYPILARGRPPYIGRGAPVFLVLFVYGLVIAIPVVLLVFGAMGVTVAASLSPDGAPVPAFGGFFALFPLIQLLGLAVTVLTPTIILATERHGIGGGLNVPKVVEAFVARPGPALLAGVIYWVAGLLGGLGIIACCIGIIVSLPYGYSVIGGMLTVYGARGRGRALAGIRPSATRVWRSPSSSARGR